MLRVADLKDHQLLLFATVKKRHGTPDHPSMTSFEGPLTLLTSYYDRHTPTSYALLKGLPAQHLLTQPAEYTLTIFPDKEVSVLSSRVWLWQDTTPIHTLPLKGCHVQFLVANDSVPMFKLTNADNDKTYFFSSDDEKNLEKWMGEILNAIEEEATAPQYKYAYSCNLLIRRDKTEQTLYEKSMLCQAKPHWLSESDISLGSKLGSGAFGCVYNGSCHGSIAAIKVFHKQELDARDIEDFVQEVEILQYVDCRCMTYPAQHNKSTKCKTSWGNFHSNL